jgi:hypothetical protein
MLSRRRTRIGPIDAEAERQSTILETALRREREASSDEIAKDWAQVAMAVGHKMGKHVDLDPSTRIALNALFVPDREPAKRVDLDPSTRIAMNVLFVPDRAPATARRPRHYPKPMPVDAPRSVLSPRSQLFCIQFVGATPDRGPIHDSRDAAYSQALRREREASSDEIAKDWAQVAMAVGHKMGKRVDLDPSTRIALNALFVPDREPAKRVDLDPSTRIAMNVLFVPNREPATARRPRHYPKPMPVDAPRSVLSPRSQLFRIQFVGATPDRGPTTLKKVQIRVAAIVAAANTLWPPQTIGLRILDHEEREVFGQQKADRRRTSRQVGDDAEMATSLAHDDRRHRDQNRNHTFRATGIMAYLRNGGTLEKAAAMASLHDGLASLLTRVTGAASRAADGRLNATRWARRAAETFLLEPNGVGPGMRSILRLSWPGRRRDRNFLLEGRLAIMVAGRSSEGFWRARRDFSNYGSHPSQLNKLKKKIQASTGAATRAEKSKSWLWPALTVVLGAVLAIVGTATVMRQKPQHLVVAPPEAQQEPAPRQPAKIAQRAQPSPNSTAPAASVPPGSQPIAQSGAEPPNDAPDASSPAVPGMARAAILIASDNPKNPVVSLGSTVWSTIRPLPGQPATVAVKADADIPDLKMHATMTLRKNTDPTLEATHTIDLKFSFADGAPITGVKDVVPKMGNLGSTASEALRGLRIRISDVYFLIALAKGDQVAARNLDLMGTRAWFDFPLLLNDNRIAILVIQKSTKGGAMLAKALEAWK